MCNLKIIDKKAINIVGPMTEAEAEKLIAVLTSSSGNQLYHDGQQKRDIPEGMPECEIIPIN